MNTNDHEHEARMQVDAERAERERFPVSRDPRLNRYRLIVRALRQPLEPQLGTDFDARVASIAEHGKSDGFEEWMIVLLLLAMGVGALLFVGPALANAAHTMVSVTLPPLPWHELAMAAICIGVVWAIDIGWMRTHPSSRAA